MMSNKKIMAIVTNSELGFISIKDELDEYYKYLECDTIQVLDVKINNTSYTLILDDEGKLKEHYVNCVFLDKDKNQIDYIANHLIIQKYDYARDEAIDLSRDDIEHLIDWFKNCTKLIDFEKGRFVPTIEL